MLADTGPPEPPALPEPSDGTETFDGTERPPTALGSKIDDAEAHSPAPTTRESSPREEAVGLKLGVDYGLDPRSVSADRLRRMIAAGVFSILAAVPVIIASFSWPPGRFLLPVLWIFLVLALVARAWWWPAVRFRHMSYRIDGASFVIRRGVWWRSVHLVPRSRVQHTDVSQGPIERHFDLGTLIVHTAGTQYAAVPLSGLAHDTAMELRDILIDESHVDDAV